MSLAVRIECDAPDCGRHFIVPAHDLSNVEADTSHSGPGVRIPAVHLGNSMVILPEGWASAGKGGRHGRADDPLRFTCRDHNVDGTAVIEAVRPG